MRARARDEDAWLLEPHVCRVCFGRLVARPTGFGRSRYLCTNCGASEVGADAGVLCCCGLTLRRHAPGDGPVDAGLRCQPNPEPTPEFPSLIVAAEAKI